MSPYEVLLADLESTRAYSSTHPFELVFPQLKSVQGFHTSDRLSGLRNGSHVAVGGLAIAKQRPPTAGGFMFMTLEDHKGFVNLVITPQVMGRFRQPLLEEPLVLVRGKLEKAEGVVNVRVQTVQGIRFIPGKRSIQSRDFR